MVYLITEHIDIWTGAQTQKINGGRGRGNGSANQSPFGIKKLRELILELAVRGKLVPQDPNDEPASVLLEKIAKEKARLIKEGKIKEQKPLQEIIEDEKLFELPLGWKWARLGYICEFVNGFAFKSTDFSDTGVGIVKIGDIQNGEISTTSMSRVNEDVVADLDASLRVKKREMLIAMSGATTGKLGFNTTNEIFYINQRVGKISPYCLHIGFLYYPLATKIAENLAKSMGSAIPNLSTAQIKNIVLALPPLSEQHRIVAKVDELMALCDQLEQQQTDSNAAHQTIVETLLATLTTAAVQGEFAEAWQRIANHFNTLFTTEHSIDQLKQTILQLAVMGKLVPQDPNDESADILLNKINNLRSRLLDEEAERKSKALAPIDESHYPFEIKSNWRWIRLGQVHDITSSKRIHAKDYVSQGVPFYRSKEIGELGRGHEVSTSIFITEEKFNGLKSLPGFPKHYDLMIASIGASIGNNWICDKREFYYKDGNVTKISSHNLANMRYLQIYIASPVLLKQIAKGIAGSAYNALTIVKIKNLLFPLPPLAEQHRIVAKVDELMAICDALKDRLNDAQTTQVQLANAIVEQAVA